MGLSGWVLNSAQGLTVEVEGERAGEFVERLRSGPPPNAVVRGFTVEWRSAAGERGFTVNGSDGSGSREACLLPDLAVCGDCLRESLIPGGRRYRYPFTTCTQCGPRYSIAEGIPYDRPLTSMRGFPMCAACQREYRDPSDRRFHAQTNCCPVCGPHLELWDSRGRTMETRENALLAAAELVRKGGILALKGLGGFQLIADACNAAALNALRLRKRRPAKPFAVMVADQRAAREICAVSEEAMTLLSSPQAPIVLLERLPACPLPDEVAPANPFLGLLLPTTPLHALLLTELDRPLVATSGNLTDDPICFDEAEALSRLGEVADLFLVHNRPILRPVDDSVVRWMDGQPVMLRRARGYAPLPLDMGCALPEMVATGAHMKNTVAFSRGSQIFVSQHLGDLASEAGLENHRRAAQDFLRIYSVEPSLIAHDLHPDYGSTSSARELAAAFSRPLHGVQHHAAHVWAAMAEHRLERPLLGVAWDGTGYGTDGKIWGGEFFVFDGEAMTRFAHLREFPLAGGERAVREPRRSLLGICHVLGCAERARQSFSEAEWRVVLSALRARLNTPVTTSAGRLFDAVSAALGLCPAPSFEGQAAMELEFAARASGVEESVPLDLRDGVIDWGPLMEALLPPARPVAARARLFHNSIASAIGMVASRAGLQDVVLAGGCFQNALLVELAASDLRRLGFRVWIQHRFPPNDGSIAMGQIAAAAAEWKR